MEDVILLKKDDVRFKVEKSVPKFHAVYLLSFDDHYFYVGSTVNFRNRVRVYYTRLKDGIFPNKYMSEVFKKSNKVAICVLEVVQDVNKLKSSETFFINKLFNEKCLNRSKDANGNTGVKWTKEERKKISDGLRGIKRSPETKEKMKQSQLKRQLIANASKKVFSYDIEGNFICAYNSIEEASKATKISNPTISSFGKGREKPCKGLRFKFKSNSEEIPSIDPYIQPQIIEEIDLAEKEILDKFLSNAAFNKGVLMKDFQNSTKSISFTIKKLFKKGFLSRKYLPATYEYFPTEKLKNSRILLS